MFPVNRMRRQLRIFLYTRLQKYLTCPEQYRLYYVERFRPKVESASLVFGSVMHLALAEYFRRKADPVAIFLEDWDAVFEKRILAEAPRDRSGTACEVHDRRDAQDHEGILGGASVYPRTEQPRSAVCNHH